MGMARSLLTSRLVRAWGDPRRFPPRCPFLGSCFGTYLYGINLSQVSGTLIAFVGWRTGPGVRPHRDSGPPCLGCL